MFFATLGNKETSPTTSKKEEKVPNHQTGRTIRVFSLLTGADFAWSLRAATISHNSRDPCSFHRSPGRKCAWEESITSDQMKPQLSAMGRSTKKYQICSCLAVDCVHQQQLFGILHPKDCRSFDFFRRDACTLFLDFEQ